MYIDTRNQIPAAIRRSDARDRCADCPARSVAICAMLDDRALGRFRQLGQIEQLRRGETFCWEGQEADMVATVRSGLVKLTASLADGREQIVGTAWPGDVIGRPFGGQVVYCATALADTLLCVVRRDQFERFSDENPPFMRALLARTLADLDRMRGRLLILGRKSARERVATLLLELCARQQPDAHGVFSLPVRRQQIADMLGLTIETVSRQITGMVDDGIVALPGPRKLDILDRHRLTASAG